MFDLHCHLLPAIDDGATDLAMALEMARMSVADGVHTVACTPHIYPGLYENTADGIRIAIGKLQAELDREGIPLTLVIGADVHLDPSLPEGIRAGRVPTIAGSRYLLLEPPHHVAPPRFEDALATDAHHPRRRPPLLAEARDAAARLVGEVEADHLVSTRPRGVVDNMAPDDLPGLPDGRTLRPASSAPSFWKRLRGTA